MCARLARPLILAAAVSCLYGGARPPQWKLTRSAHFELYSQLEDHRTGQLLDWFEQLRTVFLGQSIVPSSEPPTVRLIVFPSVKVYEPYRVREFSDGSYARNENHAYITMFRGAEERRIAAHELAHAVFTSNGAKFPLWLSEGLAEFFSTVHIDEGSSEIGGDFAARRQTLERRAWIPLREVLALPSEASLRGDRERSGMFYAESWLLCDMLVLSPEYGPRFGALFGMLRSGVATEAAFQSVYGKPPAEINRDLEAWLFNRAGARSIRMAGVAKLSTPRETTDLANAAAGPMLADMLAAAGEHERAGALLRDLAREDPENAGIQAALGAIALEQGNQEAARGAWKQAIAQGLPDADIAYRYALMADDAGLPADEVRSALERAVALRPDFDDARYKLALIEKRAGRYDAAVAQFRAMRSVAPGRAFAYWTALADALNELGKRDEAVEAAHRAVRNAKTDGERARAENLAYVAQTDFAVQFARDSDGRAEMITTRVPHQTARDWNPFVEAGDDIHTARGVLREIDCDGAATRIVFDAAGALLTLTIADPTRVRMRNGPEELVCGPQQGVAVEVQYAASKKAAQDGTVRGIDFAPLPALEK